MQKTEELEFKVYRRGLIEQYQSYIKMVENVQGQAAQERIIDEDVKQIIETTANFLRKFELPFLFSIAFQKIPTKPIFIEQPYLLDRLITLISHIIQKNVAIAQKHSQNLGLICKYLTSPIEQKIFQLISYGRKIVDSNKNWPSLQKIIDSASQIQRILIVKSISKSLNEIFGSKSRDFLSVLVNLQDTIEKMTDSSQMQSNKQSKYRASSSEILKFWPLNIFDEKLVNYCRYILHCSHPKNYQEMKFCCQLFFNKKKQHKSTESKYFQHKNYHWPIKLATIVKHVKKTIIGFLNMEGGIIYVGMKENLNEVLALGIALSNDQVVDFFKWVHELCESIYPQLPTKERQDSINNYYDDLQKLKNRQNSEGIKTSFYRANKYVAVEYLSIVQEGTFMDEYNNQDKDRYQRFYLIKIKIKPGSKAQTYHLLKQQKSGEIECFERRADAVKKLTLQQFFQLYYKRIAEYMEQAVSSNNVQNKCPMVHFDY